MFRNTIQRTLVLEAVNQLKSHATADEVYETIVQKHPDISKAIDAKDCCGAELNVYGFEILAPVTNGSVDQMTLFLFGIGAIIILAIMAMVFRNLYLIIKRSGESTPFQPDNIRMRKEIGYFAISVPIIGFVMSIVCRLVLGVDTMELNLKKMWTDCCKDGG